MIPITSAANCFVDEMNVMTDVYRRVADGSYAETGVRMSVSEGTLHGANFRMENVSFATARLAEAKVKKFFPGMVVKIMGSDVVTDKGMPAIGTLGTNFFIVIGNAMALAPAWLLLANSIKPGVMTVEASDIEFYVQQRGAGLWNQILDYSEAPSRG